ncbi:ferric reductase-like protein like transmembrane component [Coleophoma cylindrospora]|uniref:ferric-chelate reductase (NADPH) n=1 Tax=Coleophoma cylindrospora TaxID=1849047 RepID=A0A3D8SSU5_9HELO|nr:ferric reductase-like protein like transmembrane component [Coleophoma cylindrospora]
MDMGSTMMMGGAPSDSPLNSSGVDFSNDTQASTFLGEVLDDTVFQVDANMYARNFWYGACAIIGITAVFNITQRLILSQRIKAAAAEKKRPAAPSNIFTTAVATTAAIVREATYAQWTPQGGLSRVFKLPPVGTIALVVAYLAWCILLLFVNNNVEGGQHFTSLGVRASWLAVAQVPLLILLAGKNNLIGLVTGVSYERLNVLHRWVARGLFFLATMHVIFLHLAWNAYGLGPLEYSTDSCIPTGWAVYAILIWMNISTIAPIRNFSYEFFVVQHIITFFGFIIAVMFHLPSTALYSRVYIFIPIALYILDRLVRTARYSWNNVRPGHATLTALEGGVTKVCIKSKTIKKWAPGSHVLLSLPKFGPGQSHPATIASVPSSHDGHLVFILKGHKGFTSRILKNANSSTTSLLPTQSQESLPVQSHVALIDGPYGSSHNDFAAFDSVVLVAGSTGITFTLPILLDIAERAKNGRLPLKRIVFLWVVKNTSWTSWISTELTSAADALRAVNIELQIRVHVTCDDAFTSGVINDKDGCGCENNNKPCCCEDISSGSSSPVNEKEKSQAVTKTRSFDSSASRISGSGIRSRVLPCARFQSGRPDVYNLLWDILDVAEGETGVGVCGPLGLSADVRRAVVKCSDERGVHKGTGAQGIYLHAECFGW